MPTDRDEAALERHGRSVQAAYRAARLTPTQYERHRARLAARYTESPIHPRNRLAVIAVATAIALLLIFTLLAWNSLVPDDDRDEQALTTLPPTSVSTLAATAPPEPATPTQANVSSDNEDQQAIDTVLAEREAAIPYPIPEACNVSEWGGPENRVGGQYPSSITGGDDWRYSYYLEGDNVTLNTRLGVLYQGTNSLVLFAGADGLPSDVKINATLIESTGQFGRVGLEALLSEGVPISDPQDPGSNLMLYRLEFNVDYAGCWLLSVRSEEVDVAFNHTFYVYPRVDREAVAAHDRIYLVEPNGMVWGWDLETEKRLFEIDAGADIDAALSPDGTRLYLVNINDLIAVDSATGRELWRVSIEDRIRWIDGLGPSTVAVSQDGQQILVYSSNAPERQWVQVFEALDGSKISNIGMISGNCPAEMRASPDGQTLYLVCIRFGGARILDLASGETSDLIVGQFSGSVLSADGQLLYAVTTSKRLLTIDMNTRETVSDVKLDLPASPSLLLQLVDLSADGTRLYLGLGRENDDGDSGSQDVREIAIVDVASGTTIDVVEPGILIDGEGMAVDGDGRIYASAAGKVMIVNVDGSLEVLRAPVQLADVQEVRQFLIARAAKEASNE